MANVFELLMQLLQIRSDNRQMVLRECLEPLKRELDCIHLEYLNNFHRYRASVLKDDVTGALVRELNHDLDLIMARRSQLSQMLLGLMGVSHNRLDRHKKYLQTFVETVFEYLTLQKRGTDDDVLFQMEVKQLIGRHNPTYEPLQLNVVGGAKVIQVIDIVLDHFKIKYRRIGETYADFRTFLLK